MNPLPTTTGATLFGLTGADIGTLLAGLATLAVLMAIYAASTVRNPMARRVKALNERREQLKAGIVASTSKRRTKIVHQNDTTDRMRTFLKSLKVLQDDQLKLAQQKLAQAGIRSKDWAIAVIFGRLVLPIAIGGAAALLIYGLNFFPEWGEFKKFGAFAGALLLQLQSARYLRQQSGHQTFGRNPQGRARRSRSARDLRGSRPHC